MKSKGIVVVVAGGGNFNQREFNEMLNKRLDEESDFPIEIEISVEEKSVFPEINLESIEEIEAKQEKFFKKISYQQQQKELRFLNKRKKSN